MHDRNACVVGTHHARVRGHQIAIAEHVLDSEKLVREPDVILDHRLFQRRKT